MLYSRACDMAYLCLPLAACGENIIDVYMYVMHTNMHVSDTFPLKL